MRPRERRHAVNREQLEDQQWDPIAVFRRIARLARLDEGVFAEVRDDKAQTLPALAVVVGAVLLAAVGGWLFLVIEYDGLSGGRIFVREFLLGGVFAVLLWGVWGLAAELMLTQVYGVQVSRISMFRCLGYAAAPAAIMVLMLLTPIALAVGLVAIVAWWHLSGRAIAVAVPGASEAQATMANLFGFAVFAVVLAVLGNQAGMAPGVFVQAGGVSEYVERFNISINTGMLPGGATDLVALAGGLR